MSADELGEVIASGTFGVRVECRKLYEAPAFGSFVRVASAGEGECYGVVTGVETAPYDSARVVQAHGLAAGELEERKPHLNSLLRTVFEARLIGWRSGSAGEATPGPPAQPPRLHDFVYGAEAGAVRRLTSSPQFLRALVGAPVESREDLLAAAIAWAAAAWGAEAPLVTWGKALARLLAGDYATLEAVMERVGSMAPAPGAASRWEEPLPLAGGDAEDPFA